MDIKVVKFALIPLAAFVALAEIYELVILCNFNLRWYVFPYGYYYGISALFAMLALALKIALILGSAFAFLQYSKGDVKLAKYTSFALPGIFFLRIVVIFIWGGPHLGSIYGLLTLLAFIASIVNLVFAALLKPQGYVKAVRQPVYYNQPPVLYQHAPQQFSAQASQTIPDQLAALQVLVDNGTLTQAEFKAAKQRIIGS